MKKRHHLTGTATIVDQDTGETRTYPLTNISDPEKDSNFYKLFLNDFLDSLELIANQKTKILCWILKNMKRDNHLPYTYRNIADETGASYATVAETMQTLLNGNFLRKHNSGYYIINPNIIFKGVVSRRYMALRNFNEATPGEKDSLDEMRLRNINKNITRLQKRAKELQKNPKLQDLSQSENT